MVDVLLRRCPLLLGQHGAEHRFVDVDLQLVAVGIDEWIWFVTAGESLAFFKKKNDP